MTVEQAMKVLESMGTEQNRKIYARHGGGPKMFGVSFANLGKLKKQIKTDHELALGLWRTGNMDARTLATMIADPAQATDSEINEWMDGVGYYMLGDLLAGYVHKTRFARKKMEQWTKAKGEFPSQAGWDLIGLAAMDNNNEVDDGYFVKRLKTIEEKIHRACNRTRHAMNGALIAIGLRSQNLKKLALEAASRIGKVEVDHGETGCVTPDAAVYIKKAEARMRKKKRPR